MDETAQLPYPCIVTLPKEGSRVFLLFNLEFKMLTSLIELVLSMVAVFLDSPVVARHHQVLKITVLKGSFDVFYELVSCTGKYLVFLF